MPGPRIYTEAWERLKVAAKETEAREGEEPQRMVDAPEKPKSRRGPRLLIVAMAVLAFLSILTTGLWVDSQTRLTTAAHDVADFRTRLELLQEKTSKLEEERQRISDENGTLSLQYEQRVVELTQLEEELEALRSQKDRSRVRPKQAAAADEKPSVNAPDAPKAAQGTPPVQTGNAPKLQKQEQQDVKVYKID
jgi:hypothetical protein